LVQQVALNQELAQCVLEDYARNCGFDRDRLLLASVQHTAQEVRRFPRVRPAVLPGLRPCL
jgi:hypothetical protein